MSSLLLSIPPTHPSGQAVGDVQAAEQHMQRLYVVMLE
jgi:hypothetical protein